MTFLAPFSPPMLDSYGCCPHTQFLRWAWRSELRSCLSTGILSTKPFPQPSNPLSGGVLLPIQLLRNLGLRRVREFDSQHTAGHRKYRSSPSVHLEPLLHTHTHTVVTRQPHWQNLQVHLSTHSPLRGSPCSAAFESMTLFQHS